MWLTDLNRTSAQPPSCRFRLERQLGHGLMQSLVFSFGHDVLRTKRVSGRTRVATRADLIQSPSIRSAVSGGYAVSASRQDDFPASQQLGPFAQERRAAPLRSSVPPSAVALIVVRSSSIRGDAAAAMPTRRGGPAASWSRHSAFEAEDRAVRSVRLPPSLKLRRTAVALAEAG